MEIKTKRLYCEPSASDFFCDSRLIRIQPQGQYPYFTDKKLRLGPLPPPTTA